MNIDILFLERGPLFGDIESEECPADLQLYMIEHLIDNQRLLQQQQRAEFAVIVLDEKMLVFYQFYNRVAPTHADVGYSQFVVLSSADFQVVFIGRKLEHVQTSPLTFVFLNYLEYYIRIARDLYLHQVKILTFLFHSIYNKCLLYSIFICEYYIYQHFIL